MLSETKSDLIFNFLVCYTAPNQTLPVTQTAMIATFRLNSRLALSVTLLGALLLSSCRGTGHMWDDYLSRLERTLDVAPPAPTAVTLPSYPARRDLLIAIPESRLTLIDAWELNHCELFSLIGERNSILGKLSEPDVRFNYELRLLKSLPDCIADDDTPEDARSMLRDLLATKQGQLPAVLWNATFAQSDFHHLFSLSERPLKPNEPLDIPLYETTLTQLSRLTDMQSTVTSALLSQSVKLTSEFSLAGATLQSQKLAIIRLTQANSMLSTASENETLCPNGRVLSELDIARNVMVNVFIQRIQPWLVSVADAERASLAPMSELATLLAPEDQPLLADYFLQTTNLNERFLETIRQHTEQWQTLFDRCNQSATQ